MKKVFEQYTIRKRNFEELKEWYDNNDLYEEDSASDNQLLEKRYKELKNLLWELEEFKDKALCRN